MARTRRQIDFRQTGFSLVELVVVIVVVAVLGSLAVPRFFDERTFAERGYFEELAAALRLAQSAAVGTGCPVRFELTAAAFSAAQQQAAGGRCDPSDTSWAQPLRYSDGTAVAGSAPAGVSGAPPVTIVFDALGATDLAGNTTIGVGPYTLTVQAGSGYIEVP